MNDAFINQLEALVGVLKAGAANNVGDATTSPTSDSTNADTPPTNTTTPHTEDAMKAQLEVLKEELVAIKAAMAGFSNKDLSGVIVAPAPSNPTPPQPVTSPTPTSQTFTPAQAAQFLASYGAK
jgi:hypothetical protein